MTRWLKENKLGDFEEVFYANGFEGPNLLTLQAQQFVVSHPVFAKRMRGDISPPLSTFRPCRQVQLSVYRQPKS